MVFTHLFLKSLNEETGCLENKEDRRSTLPRLSIVGQDLIDTINFFDIRSLLRFLNDLQRRKTAAEAALKREQARAENPHDESEGSQEAEESGQEEAEAEESEPEDDEEQEVEPNIARVARCFHPDSALLCKLLADYESVSELTRTRGVFGVPQTNRRPRRLRLLLY